MSEDNSAEELKKLQSFVSGLLCDNRRIRQSAASMLGASAIMNLASARIIEELGRLDLQGFNPDHLMQIIYETLRRDSLSMTAATTRHILNTEITKLVNDWVSPAKPEVTNALCIRTGFSRIDKELLPGGISGGKVLVLRGDEEATAAMLQRCIDRAARESVSSVILSSRFKTSSKVTDVPASWWAGSLVKYDQEKEVFSQATLGKRSLVCIDDLALLGAGSGEESVGSYYKDLVTKLRRAAKRVKLPIVTRLVGVPDIKLRSQAGAYVEVHVTLQDGSLHVDGEPAEA
jgi:hypothetical protein